MNYDDRSSYKRCSQYFDVGGSSRWNSCMGDILEVQYDFNMHLRNHMMSKEGHYLGLTLMAMNM